MMYKLTIVYKKDNLLQIDYKYVMGINDALKVRNRILNYVNVLTVSNPIEWFGAGGPAKCQKLLKMWPNSGKITEK